MRLILLISVLCLVIIVLSAGGALADDEPGVWGDWPKWGDQGDGAYRNPVLPADFSDVDCIGVGKDFYAISSTFQYSPGVVILHSRDLVNWTILGHAVTDLNEIGPELNWDHMSRYGRGIWAGSIRFHDNKFWIYFGTPDEGYFMTTTENPAGLWTPVHQVLKGPGWDDCCPLFDDDGQVYLVGTNFADGYKIHLWKLTPDGRDIVPSTDTVIHQSSGSEANKLYKINGYYYHLYSESHNGRYVMMERSRYVFGPYSEIRQISYPDKQYNEPNQGGLVQAPDGRWWWFTHHGTGAWEGRCDSLVPVTWIDGWPILGSPDDRGIGSFDWSGPKPVLGGKRTTPQTNDDFNETSLAPQWEWNYQPRAGMWSLTERRGWLRLHAFAPLKPDEWLGIGNILTQRSFRTSVNEATIKLDIGGMEDGQRAGLCHFGHAFLGVVQDSGLRSLAYYDGGVTTVGPPLTGKILWLRSTWGLDGVSQFSYSLDGRTFSDFGAPYQLTWRAYRGDRIGIFTYNNAGNSGFIDVDFFHYKYDLTK